MSSVSLSQHRSTATLQLIGWALALAVLVFQALPFLVGYRLTADDVLFQRHYFDGFAQLVQFSHEVAAQQGRVGHYVVGPLLGIGPYLSDHLWFRILAVAIHFLPFVVASHYVATLAARPVALLTFVLLSAMHPLAFEHLPPNSYPLLNSIPFLIILALRLFMFRLRSAAYRPAFEWPAAVVLAFCMTLTEHMFLVGCLLIAIDWIILGLRRHARPIDAARFIIGQRAFHLDVAAAAVSLAAYLAYRLFHPSSYSGNEFSGIANVGAMVLTTLKHIAFGLSVARPDGGAVHLFVDPRVIALAIASAIAAWLALVAAGRPGRAVSLGLIAGGLFFAIAYTLVVASSAKYQEWCQTSNPCAYLDSRISYYGAVVAILGILLFILDALPQGRTAQRGITIAALVIGALSGLTYAQNLTKAGHMRDYVAAWPKATAAACDIETQNLPDAKLLALIDPQSRVSMHPGFDRAGYWRAYMRDADTQRRCRSDKESLSP